MFNVDLQTLTPLLYISVSQPVGRGPLVSHRALLVGRQDFFILLKITTLETNFIKIIKSDPY